MFLTSQLETRTLFRLLCLVENKQLNKMPEKTHMLVKFNAVCTVNASHSSVGDSGPSFQPTISMSEQEAGFIGPFWTLSPPRLLFVCCLITCILFLVASSIAVHLLQLVRSCLFRDDLFRFHDASRMIFANVINHLFCGIMCIVLI